MCVYIYDYVIYIYNICLPTIQLLRVKKATKKFSSPSKLQSSTVLAVDQRSKAVFPSQLLAVAIDQGIIGHNIWFLRMALYHTLRIDVW